MSLSDAGRNHSGDTYWLEVREFAERLWKTLQILGREKAWRSSVPALGNGQLWKDIAPNFCFLGVAQAVVTIKHLPTIPEETDDQKKLRRAASAFENRLLLVRAEVKQKELNAMRKMRIKSGNPEDESAVRETLEMVDADLEVAGKYARPMHMDQELFIALRIDWALKQKNIAREKMGLPLMPAGLGSTGVIVALTCESLEWLNENNPKWKGADAVAIRKKLTDFRGESIWGEIF